VLVVWRMCVCDMLCGVMVYASYMVWGVDVRCCVGGGYVLYMVYV